jgi:glycosyltransferase involved in cell wall biosynthesis
MALRILFVTRNTPFPPVAGSSQRTALLIESLQAIGEVDLFVIGPNELKPFLENQGYRVVATARSGKTRRGLWRSLFFLTESQVERIWRLGAGPTADYQPDSEIAEIFDRVIADGNYDLIVGRYLAPSAQAGMFRAGLPPTIVDIDDVDSRAIAAKIDSPATGFLLKWIMRGRAAAVARNEKSLWDQATRLWFSNPDDLRLAADRPADVIPNLPYILPDAADLQPSAPDSRVILWVGSFNHRVNMDGVEHFLGHAWNRIFAANPGVRFRIVGSHLDEAVRRRWQTIPGVDVIGFAESLAPHYAECALSIVPLLDGAGTKIKVLESLAYRRACVVTRHSIAGYESLLRDGDGVRVGDNLDALLAPIAELLTAPALRHKTEERGRAVIEGYFTRQAVRDAMARSVAKTLASHRHD